jgi:hypothetical protein
VAQSGCPAPDLTMRVGAIDVTSYFRRVEHPVAVSGERGLRTMTCTVSLWSWAPSFPATTTATGHHRVKAFKMAPPIGGSSSAAGSEAGSFVVYERYDGMALRCSATAGPGRIDGNKFTST